MKGTLNVIWLTTPNGVLHAQIIPHLTHIIHDAQGMNYEVILWTNCAQLQACKVEAAQKQGIVVKDHSVVQQSRVYSH